MRKTKKNFGNNMSTDIKLIKSQFSKIIQSGRFLGVLLGKLAGSLTKFDVPLAKNLLAPLTTMEPASALDRAIQRKMHEKGVVKARKG